MTTVTKYQASVESQRGGRCLCMKPPGAAVEGKRRRGRRRYRWNGCLLSYPSAITQAPPWKASAAVEDGATDVCAFSHFPENDEKFTCLCLSLKEIKFTVPNPQSTSAIVACSSTWFPSGVSGWTLLGGWLTAHLVDYRVCDTALIFIVELDVMVCVRILETA